MAIESWGDLNMKTKVEISAKRGKVNHLAGESSPYLRHHAHNPVDWYPWSDEALEKARREDKPIFLSIGYAACHWCHVMERESFENEEIAKILNNNFISIKVDREQRPDLDQIYMAATIVMNGSGGWPMSVFLTPELKPFFAGTYFPPNDSYGRPGFKNLILQIAQSYAREKQNLYDFSGRLTDSIRTFALHPAGSQLPDHSVIDQTVRNLMANYDDIHGGFGHAPKFPHPTDLSFLLKAYSASRDKKVLEAIERTLYAMARGGMYDQIGGGFHRYSTDAGWLVPHFEKMLYDNAMLAVTYGEVYQATGHEFYKNIACETLDFMIREMQDETGGFYSSLDADSDGEEGKFYVWKKSDVDNLLDESAPIFCSYYNITDSGNFDDNTNIPNIDRFSDSGRFKSGIEADKFDQMIASQRKALYAERSNRVRPLTDTKILTSWNGLTLSALSKGYQITQDEKYRKMALQAAEFIRNNLYRNKRLIHSYCEGKLSAGLFLEDYAYLSQGLIDLYEVVYDFKWIEFASELADQAIEQFADDKGNLYLAPDSPGDYYIRPKDTTDGATPAPGSIFIGSLLKLADITGDKSYREQAERSLIALSESIKRAPHTMVSAVNVFSYLTENKYELILVGKSSREVFMREIYSRYFPNRIIIVSDDGSEKIEPLKGRKSIGKTTAYVCKNSYCMLPISTIDDMKKQLADLTKGE
jgi:uncharacterized protein YyaL (SSP411 family)